MRIALLHPSYWPEVRRGGERLVHDVAAGLAARGHDVTLITSHRARRSVNTEDGFRVIRNWRPPTRLVHRRAYEFHLTNAPAVAAELLAGRYDLVHAFHHVDAWAAAKARVPFVYSMNGIPARQFLVARRYRMALLETAVERAKAVTVLSDAAAEPFERYLLRRPVVLAGGVVLEKDSKKGSDPFLEKDSKKGSDPFLENGSRKGSDPILCAASLNDSRKRGAVLMEAFELLRRERPEVRLVLAGLDDPTQGPEPLRLPEGAVLAPVTDSAQLARAYASAAVSVLPAVHEAFGLVLVESLAAGTPAVAARSGACPEVIDDDRVGRLFEPDDPADLARALGEALDLAEHDETAARCREHAARWDWDRILPRYEELYERAISSKP